MNFRRSFLLAAQVTGCAAALYAVAADEIAAAAQAATASPVQLDPLKPQVLTLAEMMLLTRQPAAIIVDARPAGAFARGHIAGAINLPVETALTEPDTLLRLPAGPNPIVYCDSNGCLASVRLARLIKETTGRNVSVYSGGWNEWNALDLPREP
jgi:3-mercaptopyruvate sulfurtransferase SseA